MTRISLISLALAGLLQSNGLFADPSEDLLMKAALLQTKNLLANPEERTREANKTAKGRAAMARVEKLGAGPQLNEEIFGLAGDIFEDLFDQTSGDPAKMMQILEAAEKDPEGFAKMLKGDRKQKLHSISTKMPLN